ncbi:MAG: hypothetical protein OXQ90_07910, partial [Gammaproteobacteria bacterium]|nr:hypothetical protein [Gammaproteobacteria bacterium]
MLGTTGNEPERDVVQAIDTGQGPGRCLATPLLVMALGVGLAAAAEDARDEAYIEEIIVTAEKREE